MASPGLFSGIANIIYSQTMRILILQSRRRPEVVAMEQGEYARALADTGATPVFVSTLDESQPWMEPEKVLSEVNGVILGGSGEFDFDGGRTDDDPARLTSKEILARLTPFLTYVFEHNVPTLGVCYGHQMIGESRGVTVVNDLAQKKVGSFPINRTEEGRIDPLFEALPDTFIGQYGHKDSLSELPEGAVLLATGENCKFSALRYSSKIYTVQFHPELTADDSKNKISLTPGYLPEGVTADDIVKASPEASTLIPRFIQTIVQ